MAENVQKNLEASVPALGELKKSNIFSEEELTKIANRLKKNEEKLAGSKYLDVYKSSIKYDQGLLMELRKRKMSKNALHQNKHLDWIFIKRIVNTYRRGLKCFSTDYEFNIAYLEFLKLFPEYQQIANKHVETMIETFQSEPNVFREAAAWFFQCEKFNESRSILLRGQDAHPKNLDIYLDLIELEIRRPIAKGIQNRLEKYIDAIVKNNVTHRFLEEVVKLLENYGHLQEVVDYAIKQLLIEYRDEVGVWHYVAIRELKGENFPSGSPERKITTYSIERAISRYKDGILKLPSDKKSLLWKKYLDVLADLIKIKDYRNPQTERFLKEALVGAERARIEMDESHYLAWIDCCEKDDALLVKKFEEGTKKHPSSVMLWSLYLKYYTLQDEPKFAKEVFKKANNALGPNAGKIWELYVDFHLLKSPATDIDMLYEEAIAQPHPEIASLFKSRYLTWTIVAKGIYPARQLYLKLADRPPYSKKLHEEMFQAEQMEYSAKDELNICKQVLDLWTKQFGGDDINVWIQRILYIREQEGPDVNEKICEVYEEAKRTLLDEEKLALFKKLFSSETEKYSRKM